MPPQNPPFETEIVPYDQEGIARAAALILEGLPVAVPTETVYGLAADATDDGAVARIYEAKGRPGFNPLIVHVPDFPAAERIGDFTPNARAAAERYWPGPLTLVVPLRSDARIVPAVTAGLPTIAIRCPASAAMQDLLRACGRPLAAPSANASGGVSPTTASHVLRSLGGRIPLIVDSGPTRIGLESTIVAFDGDAPRLLRAGPIAFDAAPSSGGRIEAPGQLSSHYAPSKPLRLDAREAAADEWLIGFGTVEGDDTLSSSGDMEEAAASLFAALHRADLSSRTRIAVAPVPGEGIGRAINDRLTRAAAAKGEGR
ncbi:MAG: L-threonylcarbamoyladenylate synthase [Sphingomonadales bacterium]|nr:L-threonylcarbamoyladenylate synthase [Sphingomonadales bacterium]